MIDYETLQQDAFRGVVRAALTQVATSGLDGDHHFYISFNTQAPGIILSKRLKEKYPHEMTIVLQHRFWDLIVTDERFEVKLTFDAIPERLVVPFTALKVFIDPSVKFGIQFEDGARSGMMAAARPSLTEDAAYDSAGEARAENPRAALSKKPRAPRKPKSDKEPADIAASLAERRSAAEKTPPLPEPASAAKAPAPIRAIEPVRNAEPASADKSSAEIVRLDTFRKK